MNKKEAKKKVEAMKKNVKVFAQKELAKAKAEMAKAAKKWKHMSRRIRKKRQSYRPVLERPSARLSRL